MTNCTHPEPTNPLASPSSNLYLKSSSLHAELVSFCAANMPLTQPTVSSSSLKAFFDAASQLQLHLKPFLAVLGSLTLKVHAELTRRDVAFDDSVFQPGSVETVSVHELADEVRLKVVAKGNTMTGLGGACSRLGKGCVECIGDEVLQAFLEREGGKLDAVVRKLVEVVEGEIEGRSARVEE